MSNSYVCSCFMLFLDDEGYLDSELITVLIKIKEKYIAYLQPRQTMLSISTLHEVIII